MHHAKPLVPVLGLLLFLSACTTAPEPPPEPESPRPPRADHHLHIQTAALAEHTNRLGELFDEEGGPRSEERTAADALEALDAAGIERGLVLSSAYMLGAPDLPVDGVREKVRRENLWVAEQVAAHADRLVGLCSFNPIADYAFDELESCAQDPGVKGIKLHLANSDVDLTDPEQLETLARLWTRIGELGLGVLVHLRTRSEEYGAEQADAFISEVLARAPDVDTQIAHAAGWGGYDEMTDAALGAFAAAIAEGRAGTARLTFGLGAVVFLPDAAPDEEMRALVAERNARLAERLRAVGLERVVYATDWSGWPPGTEASEGIARNVELVRHALPLEADELEVVFANVGPMLSTGD